MNAQTRNEISERVHYALLESQDARMCSLYRWRHHPSCRDRLSRCASELAKNARVHAAAYEVESEIDFGEFSGAAVGRREEAERERILARYYGSPMSLYEFYREVRSRCGGVLPTRLSGLFETYL